MIKLRQYQHKLYHDIKEAWAHYLSVLAVCPTGGGKTVVFSMLIHDHTGGSAAVVHRKEILGQISLSLAALDVKHRIIAPPNVIRRIRRRHLKKFGKSYVDDRAQTNCAVCSVQTLTSRKATDNKELQRWAKQVSLTVFDEGHHYVKKGLWSRAVDQFAKAKKLFVTATPERADGRGLGAAVDGFAECMVEGPSVEWLIDQGYLAPFKYYAPPSDINTDDIPLTATGEFNAKVFRQRVVDSKLVGDAVDQYIKFAKGKKAIVFCSDVETAQEQAEAFNSAGFNFKALSGNTDAGERDKALDDFDIGHHHGLTNVDLFDEGFDVPGVEVALLDRRTASLGKFLQMIGRALRPVYAEGYDLTTREGRLAAIAAGPKPYAVVIDPVRNWELHGMPDWPRQWTLSGKDKGGRARDPDLKPMKLCVSCTQPYEAFYLACPYCGFVPEPPGRSTPDQVDGDLFELDTEAMRALFDQHRLANMDSADFEASLMDGRPMHPYGRKALVRSHNAALYRREVLKNLVGYWVGMQQQLYGRQLPEIYKRFYHRFQVDIVTAETLDVRDTDALIDKIQKRFSHDF